jgi:hypothetical protein
MDSGGRGLMVAMRCQKRFEIRLGNPHHSVDPVRSEKLVLDPTPDRSRRRFDAFGDLLDRVEFRGRFRFVSFHELSSARWHVCDREIGKVRTRLQPRPLTFPNSREFGCPLTAHPSTSLDNPKTGRKDARLTLCDFVDGFAAL